jgi:hypothetical protein
MTDPQGLAALAAALFAEGRPESWPRWDEYQTAMGQAVRDPWLEKARRILAGGAVFLPDGPPQDDPAETYWAARDADRATIATLRDENERLDLLCKGLAEELESILLTALDGVLEEDADYVCPVCKRAIINESHGGLHPSPGDHDSGEHVIHTYGDSK